MVDCSFTPWLAGGMGFLALVNISASSDIYSRVDRDNKLDCRIRCGVVLQPFDSRATVFDNGYAMDLRR